MIPQDERRGRPTSKASSKEAAQKIYEDLQNTVDSYEKKIRDRMPGTSGISIDTDSILSDTMRNIPLSSIGILQNSMFRTDRVAGMAEIFGFGGNAALFARNEQWQKEYEEAFGVMRNLQVLDVLNGIIDNFNSQLSEANRNVYDGVKWNLRYADPFYEADFKRHEAENIWSIRVCVESDRPGWP